MGTGGGNYLREGRADDNPALSRPGGIVGGTPSPPPQRRLSGAAREGRAGPGSQAVNKPPSNWPFLRF